MVYKVLGGLVPTLIGWSIISGAVPIFGGLGRSPAGLSRDVPAGVEAVADAVSGLDTNYFTHAAGTESLAPLAGKRTADGYVWQILAEGEVSTELAVTLKPIDRDHTHVETSVRVIKPLTHSWSAPGPGTIGPAFAGGIEAQINPLLLPAEQLSDGEVRRKKLKAETMISSLQLTGNPAALSAAARRRIQEEGRWDSPPNVRFQPGKPMVDVARY
jgi:hypothetical protein